MAVDMQSLSIGTYLRANGSSHGAEAEARFVPFGWEAWHCDPDGACGEDDGECLRSSLSGICPKFFQNGSAATQASGGAF
ncbi:hypothetical protein IG631_17201 [Alternaria alternata]|nr:hypothetical protein IG631_17201 [Alternaria alternata]